MCLAVTTYALLHLVFFMLLLHLPLYIFQLPVCELSKILLLLSLAASGNTRNLKPIICQGGFCSSKKRLSNDSLLWSMQLLCKTY